MVGISSLCVLHTTTTSRLPQEWAPRTVLTWRSTTGISGEFLNTINLLEVPKVYVALQKRSRHWPSLLDEGTNTDTVDTECSFSLLRTFRFCYFRCRFCPACSTNKCHHPRNIFPCDHLCRPAELTSHSQRT